MKPISIYLPVGEINETPTHLHSQEKFQLRLKVLEEGLRMPSGGSSRSTQEGKSLSNGSSRRLSLGGAENISKPNGALTRRSPSFQMRSSLSAGSSMVLKHAKGTSKSFDGGTRFLDRGKVLGNGALLNRSTDGIRESNTNNNLKENPDEKNNEPISSDLNDSVSGLLYDLLQKEVIALRKACHEKDQSLKDKDDAIEVYNLLLKRFDTTFLNPFDFSFLFFLFNCRCWQRK